MIIKYSDNNENRIYWQHRKGEEWKTAELDELIEAYERATEPGDIISRDEAIRMYCKAGCGCEPSECGLTYEQDGTEECGVVRFLKSVPSAEKTGKWIKQYRGHYLCSVCGAWYRTTDEYGNIIDGDGEMKSNNYCPNCGARMVDNG